MNACVQKLDEKVTQAIMHYTHTHTHTHTEVRTRVTLLGSDGV
jgi:hypothetical protein